MKKYEVTLDVTWTGEIEVEAETEEEAKEIAVRRFQREPNWHMRHFSQLSMPEVYEVEEIEEVSHDVE